MCIMVTGGAGFIGSHLVERLLSLGKDVRVIDDYSTGRFWPPTKHDGGARDGGQFRLFHKALEKLDPEWLAGHEPSIIYHLAAKARIAHSFRAPFEVYRTNVGGTLVVLETARMAHCPVVFASSSTCDGRSWQTAHSFRAPFDVHHLNPYAHSKHLSEELCNSYRRLFDVSVSIARFYNVYGPRQPEDTVLGIWLDQIREGKPLTITGHGTQTRDFVHVLDIVDALLFLAERADGACEPYCLGTGRSHCIVDVAKMLKPDAEMTFIARPEGELKDTRADAKSTYHRLSWRAKRLLEEHIQDVFL